MRCVRIFGCDPRVRGPGHWKAEGLSWQEFFTDYPERARGGPVSSVTTPLHPGVLDQKFALDPRFEWVPKSRTIDGRIRW